MGRVLLVVAFLALWAGVKCEVSVLENFLVPFRTFKYFLYTYLAPGAHKAENIEKLVRENKLQPRVPESVPFPCDLKIGRSPEPPTSVHRLRPGDIDVIGALGDSITAGNGLFATNVAQVSFEYRGISFSIGGQGTWREFYTLPNILKVFNPNLVGFSLNTSHTRQRESQFNVAELGAVSSDMPYMAQVLVKRILRDKRVDVQKHWKLITIMFGPNDFCTEICYNANADAILAKHKRELLQVLRTLRDHLPRTIINLLPALNTYLLKQTSSALPDECQATRRLECSCVFGSAHDSQQERSASIVDRWQRIDVEVGNSPEFQRDDFAVAVQTLAINMTLPLNDQGFIDMSYLAPDCFHFSQKGNAVLAKGVWNNMLEPVGKKSPLSYDFTKYFNCPTEENPYIFTNENSK